MCVSVCEQEGSTCYICALPLSTLVRPYFEVKVCGIGESTIATEKPSRQVIAPYIAGVVGRFFELSTRDALLVGLRNVEQQW